MTEPTAPGLRTEADLDVRVLLPYLSALGIQSSQLRAQRTFSVRFGRNLVEVGTSRAGARTARLDHLVVDEDDRPLFVVELKGTGVALTDEDQDQGISYARLVHPMAPLVFVTNGADSRLYDTITKERLDDPSAATLVRGDHRAGDEEFLRARAEALEHFVGYSRENVAAFSRAQRATRMATLRGAGGRPARKYEPAVYVPRADVRRAFDAFLASDRTVFALGGRSGFGKTNEMCALAEALGERHLTFFFSGAELATPLATALAEEFEWQFPEVYTPPRLCARLARLAERSGRPALIFVDAVDEVGDPAFPQALSDFATRLDGFGGLLRLVVSAKPDEWPRFAAFRGNPSPLQERTFAPSDARARMPRAGGARSDAGVSGGRPRLAPSAVSDLTREPSTAAADATARDWSDADRGGASAGAVFSATVGAWSEAERGAAVAAYTAAFGLAGEWRRAVLEAAHDPFMLRMIAEIGALTGALPTDPGELELVRRYVAAKLARSADPAQARAELAAVGEALLAHGARVGVRGDEGGGRDGVAGVAGPWPLSAAAGGAFSVPEAAVRAAAGLPTTAAIGDELVAFGLLVRSHDADHDARLSFAYDRVRDYVVAVHALRLLERDAAGFREAAERAFASAVGADALLWSLPYTNDVQWTAFLEVARLRVERLVEAYVAIRAHVRPHVRAAMDPRGAQDVGAAFSGNRLGGFALAFFRRDATDLPAACVDPGVAATFQPGHPAPGVVPWAAFGDRRMRSGFWFLRDPEGYAATHAHAQLVQVTSVGGLDETQDELLEERIVALARHLASELGLRRHAAPRDYRFADRIVGRGWFPLDLRELDRLTQVALGRRFYEEEHMRARYEEVLRAHRAAGHVPDIVTTSSAWTDEDLRSWRARAAAETEGGRDFAPLVQGSGELRARRRRARRHRPPRGAIRAPRARRAAAPAPRRVARRAARRRRQYRGRL